MSGKLLMTNLPLYGTVMGSYNGELLPTGNTPYKLEDCVSVIVTPDGRIGMAKVEEIFSIKNNIIETNSPYVVIDEDSMLVSAYMSRTKNIVIPQIQVKPK